MFKELYSKIKGWIMSLFLGKSDNNIPVLHISSDTQQITTLKGPPNPLTSFHSDLAYLSYKLFTPIYTSFIPDTITSSSSYNPGGLVIVMSPEFYTEFAIHNTRLYIITLNDSDAGLNINALPLSKRNPASIPPQCSWYSFHPSSSTNDSLYNGELDYPTTTHKYGYINTKVNTSNVKILVTNYSHSGVLFNYKTSNDISISNNSLIIGGIDIATYPFISRSIVNVQDTIINLNGDTFQLANANSSPGLSIVSTPSVQVKIGGKVIVDSSYRNNLCLSSISSTVVFYHLDVGTTKYIVSGLNLQNKDIVALSYTTAVVLSTGQRIYSNYLVSYSDGKVIPIIRTVNSSVDLVCTAGNIGVRFNSFWRSHYDNFIGVKYIAFQ